MSTEPAQTLERLIALTEQLTAQIGGDADLFQARRPQAVAGRIQETTRLANLYRHEMARVRENPALVAGTPPELRGRLLRASQAFERTLKRHGETIYAAKTVTEGVVRAIAEEVVRMRAASASYGPGARSQAANATAITLNRSA
jgi:hypothetical protein